MKKVRNKNKKILESKRIIKEEKKKIKLEKKSIRKRKLEKFRKTRLGKILGKVFFIFNDERDSYSFSEVFAVTIVSLILGVFACFSLFTILFGGRNYLKMSKELSKFYDAYEVLVDNYYGDIDKDSLIEEAISGMVSSVGDVYTSYADTETTDTFDEMVTGKYEGIGCTIQQLEDQIKVIEVYEESPAYKAGLMADDKIIKVDSFDALEKGVEELSNYIKYEADGKIKMVVMRGEEELTFTLERGNVEIPAITTEIYERNDKKIGYLRISIFSSVSNSQFKKELKELEEEGISGLVIDVRDNNGGYLSSVTDIANYLLPKGEIIYQIQKEDERESTKDKTYTKREYPIAVITNGNSASASEILAAAIKESYDKGYVVGTTTYGKGTVQQVKKLSDGSMIKYTVENWLTPDGNWINDKGVEPTHEVELATEYYQKPIVENDNQLQKSLDLVSE